MHLPTFDQMVTAIRQATAEQRLLSRSPLAMLIHFELLKALNELEIYGNRGGIREAYACLFEYDALNGHRNGHAIGGSNGSGMSLSSINVCASDRVTARTIGK